MKKTLIDLLTTESKSSSSSNDYNLIGAAYQQVITTDNILLPLYRDLGDVIAKNIRHLNPSKAMTFNALDFGCGPGTSTPQILKSLNGIPVNIKFIGVDRNLENIVAASKDNSDDKIEYQKSESNKVSTPDQYFDLIFCFFVLLEQESEEVMIALFTELRRVLKEKGRLFTVNCNEYLYNDRLDFLYEDNKVAGNREVFDNKLSGAKIGLRSIGEDGKAVVFNDFFWTRDNYKAAAKAAHLECVDEHIPVGLDSDGKPWKEGGLLGAYHIQVYQRQ